MITFVPLFIDHNIISKLDTFFISLWFTMQLLFKPLCNSLFCNIFSRSTESICYTTRTTIIFIILKIFYHRCMWVKYNHLWLFRTTNWYKKYEPCWISLTCNFFETAANKNLSPLSWSLFQSTLDLTGTFFGPCWFLFFIFLRLPFY